MMTTSSVGMNTDVANPKPVRHISWTGQPMKEGDNYWGESEPQPQPQPPPPPVQKVVRKRRKRGFMSPEAKKAISERMRAYWSGKRADTTTKQGEN